MGFEKICKYLEGKDYSTVKIENDMKRVYLSNDKKTIVTVERNQSLLTREDEKLIEKRLEELGYL